MKRAIATLLVSLFATTTASADPLPVRPILPASPVPAWAPTFRPLPPPVLACPDPSAERIDVAISARTSRFAGRVRITGTVKNVGGVAFVSGENQQSAYLYEIPAGGRARLVAQRSFQNLPRGAEVVVAFERGWNASSPAEGEFPPTYRLLVGYDPDILINNNPKNNNYNSANNTRDRSDRDVNGLFAL